MPTLPRLRLRKVVRFFTGLGWEFLLPGAVGKPLKVFQLFYQNFLVVDLEERVELFRELDAVSAADEVGLIDAIYGQLAEGMPANCPLPAEARRAAEEMVRGLRAAKVASEAGKDPGEALRRSLNARLPSGSQITLPKLDAAQKSIGRLLMASRLEAADKPRPPLTGDLPFLPNYTFLRVLGAGAFGTVYLARHEPTGDLRAVKAGPLTDPARFRQEVTLARKLDSPHVVRYFESGDLGGRFWIAMEYLGDTTLADLMARPDFRERPFLLPQIGEQLLAGLAALHAAGMIHRDLKPANVMVDADYRLKLIDFGLAKPVDKLHGYASTATGTLIGTPFYMSPEQLKGKKDLTPASDVYAAGALIYELFVDYPPHRADSFAEVVLKAFTESVPFDLPTMPEELRPFLDRCLRREAGDRHVNGGMALNEFRKPAEQAGRRLRHDYYKPAWVPVLDGRLLESFSGEHVDLDAGSAADQFERYVITRGLQPVDRERVAEAWPQVVTARRRVNLGYGPEGDVTAVVRDCLAAETEEWVKYIGPKNLDRWWATADVERWVAQHLNGWNHQQWREVLDWFRQGQEFWPIDEAELGRRLEQKRQELLEQRRREEQHRLDDAERRRQAAEQEQRDWNARIARDHETALRRLSEREARRQRRKELNAKAVQGVKVGCRVIAALVMLFIPLAALGGAGYGIYSAYRWAFVSPYMEGRVLTANSHAIHCVSFSQKGIGLVSGSADGAVRVWNFETGFMCMEFTGHSGVVRSVAFSPDGVRIASGGSDKTIRVWVWDYPGKEIARLTGHTKDVHSVAFSPDGTRIASGSDDRTVRVWDAATGKELHSLTGHTGLVTSVAFSPDGTRIASASWDKTVRVWDIASGASMREVIELPDWAHSVAFSPDGTRIAYSIQDKTTIVWDITKRSELHKLITPSVVRSVAFSTDGARLASASDDGTVRVWDNAGKELAKLSKDSSYALSGRSTRTAPASLTVAILGSFASGSGGSSPACGRRWPAARSSTRGPDPMPSQSLNRWDGERSAALDEIEAAHATVGGGQGPGVAAGVPRGGGDELLEGPDDAPADRLGDVLDAPPLAPEQQPLDEPAGVGPGLRPAEPRGVPVEERLQPGPPPPQFPGLHTGLRSGETPAGVVPRTPPA